MWIYANYSNFSFYLWINRFFHCFFFANYIINLFFLHFYICIFIYIFLAIFLNFSNVFFPKDFLYFWLKYFIASFNNFIKLTLLCQYLDLFFAVTWLIIFIQLNIKKKVRFLLNMLFVTNIFSIFTLKENCCAILYYFVIYLLISKISKTIYIF